MLLDRTDEREHETASDRSDYVRSAGLFASLNVLYFRAAG
jgi:hypothetical protein